MATKKGTDRHEETVRCPLCGHHVERSFFKSHATAEEYVLEKIREEHPDWVEKNGACTKCWDAYQGLSNMDGAENKAG